MNRSLVCGAGIALLAIILAGCSSNGAGGGGSSGGGGGGGTGDISGTIDGWSLGTGYTIEARDWNEDTNVYASGDIAADGSFSLTLGTPTSMQTQSAAGLELFGLTVSNDSANYAEVQELTVVDSSDSDAGTVSYGTSGASEAETQTWWYSDAATTIDGDFVFIVTITYDSLSLSSGWNEAIQTTNLSTFAATVDNGTVSGGTWTYTP